MAAARATFYPDSGAQGMGGSRLNPEGAGLLRRGLRNVGRRLFDRLIPAIRFDAASGPAFCAYAYNKSAVVDGYHVCTLIEPLIERYARDVYTYVTLGRLPGPEKVASIQVPLAVNWVELLLSLACLRPSDALDYRFIARLYTKQLCFPKRHRRLHAVRTFILAHYMSLKFRELANACDSAYVIVYYNATMLGLVRAFRRRGKRVHDVQHGYLGPDHDAYNNRNAFSLESSFRPTAFIVWDHRFGEHIQTVLGMPWQSTDYLHLKAFAKRRAGQGDRRTVLYSLQWGTPVPDEVYAAVQQLKDLNWILRMHPNERSKRSDLDSLWCLPNVTITDSREPLSVALASADLHVTFNSGVVHEAARLGVRTLVLDRNFGIRIPDEIRSGLASLVSGGGLLAAVQDSLAEKSSVVKPSVAPESLYKE